MGSEPGSPLLDVSSLLDALDADIVCLQETKLSRQKLSADLAVASGYESFFSCTRTAKKGTYSDEGFTGLLQSGNPTLDNVRVGCYEEVWNMRNISIQELLLLDGEGRCVVTDHGSFGGRPIRIGRAVIAVGDFDIAPSCIDSCDPGFEFQKSLKEAYTCWPQSSGAEEFNFGTRIDLVLAAGPRSHSGLSDGKELHCFAAFEVEAWDILLQHKRRKTDSLPRWAGVRSLKLGGSDHAPVHVKLRTQLCMLPHNVPALAARFMPELRGQQQSIVPLLERHSNVRRVDGAKQKHLCVHGVHGYDLVGEPDGHKVSSLV